MKPNLLIFLISLQAFYYFFGLFIYSFIYLSNLAIILLIYILTFSRFYLSIFINWLNILQVYFLITIISVTVLSKPMGTGCGRDKFKRGLN